MNSSRIYFMDPLRGLLMALGVVLHAGQVFNPEGAWLIQSSMTTPVAEWIISFVHIFRMPAFYIVSGYFALFTLRKYESSLFLKLRTEKILIPFLVTAVLINSLQAWMLYRHAPTSLGMGSDGFHLSTYILEGRWVSHLWFLGYLLAYVVIMYLGALVFQKVHSARNARRGFERDEIPSSQTNVNLLPSPFVRVLKRLPIEIWLLAMPLYYLVLVIAGKIAPIIYEFRFGFSLYDFLNFLQFFAFGVILCWKPTLFQRFTKLSLLKTVVLVGLWYLIVRFGQTSSETITKVLEAYSKMLITWICCHAIFSLFKTIADRPSKLATFTSSVSYTVYLFHHILVIAFGLLFIEWGFGGWVGFVLLATIVAALGIAIHVFVISRYNWASYLFNGVRLRPAGEVTVRAKVEARTV